MNEENSTAVKCPHCGTEWELDEEESRKAEFTCGTCGRAFDVQGAQVAVEKGNAFGPARLSDIVMVVIRLLAVWLGVQGASFLLTVLARNAAMGRMNWIVDLIIIGGYVVCTAWMWKLAPFIADRITREKNLYVDCGTVTLRDLYCFGFLLMGLYFAVDSFGPSLAWLHFAFIQSASTAGLSPQQQGNFYTLFECLAKFFLGLLLIFKGRKFAGMIVEIRIPQ